MPRLPPVTSAMRAAPAMRLPLTVFRRRHLDADHVFGLDPLIELLWREMSQRDGRFLQRDAFLVRVLRDRRGFLVTDMRVQRRNEHEGLAHELADALHVRFDADRAELVEIRARVRKETRAVKKIT